MSQFPLDPKGLVTECEPAQDPIGREDGFGEEVEEDQDNVEGQGEAWSNRGLPQEREFSIDDDDRPSMSAARCSVASRQDDATDPFSNLIDESNSAARSAEVGVFNSVALKERDAMDSDSEDLLSRQEAVTQDVDTEPIALVVTDLQFDLGFPSQTVDEATGLDFDVKSIVQPSIKLDGPSELASPNPATKSDSATHLDSSTVAIPPVFQALPAHIPSNFFTTRSHPWNRSGFRYLACGPLLIEPNGQSTEDELSKVSDKPPVYHTIATVPEGQVKWAWEDRSSYVYITKDGLSVTTDRGFRSARANLPIRQGRFYFEIMVDRAGGELNPGTRYEPEQAHVRIGLARRESGLNAPVGIDGYSYGIRDKTGEKVHLSKLHPYGDRFGSGDVIGVYVNLPSMRPPISDDPYDPARIERRRIPIRFRRQLYFESPEYPISKEMEDLAEAASPTKLKPKPEFHSTLLPPTPMKKPMPGQKQVAVPAPTIPATTVGVVSRDLPILKGSKLVFFKNGICQGVAFKDLLDFLPLRPHATSSSVKSNVTLAKTQAGDTVMTSSDEHLHDDGTIGYYPCVSVYGGGIARLNPGPEFKFPPPEDIEAHLDEETPPDRNVAALQTSPDCSIQASQSHPNPSTAQTWQPLSSLYPIYMAEQRALDKADAIECQRRTKKEAQQVEQAKANALKRRRVSSPSSGPTSPTGTPSSTTGAGTKASKPKKKLKGHSPNHLSPTSLTHSKSQSFKPSPLAVMEVCGNSPPAMEPGSLHSPMSRESKTGPLGGSDVPVVSPPAIEPELSPPAINGNSPPAIVQESSNTVTLNLAIPAENSDPNTSLAPLSTIASASIASESSSAAIPPEEPCLPAAENLVSKPVEETSDSSSVAIPPENPSLPASENPGLKPVEENSDSSSAAIHSENSGIPVSENFGPKPVEEISPVALDNKTDESVGQPIDQSQLPGTNIPDPQSNPTSFTSNRNLESDSQNVNEPAPLTDIDQRNRPNSSLTTQTSDLLNSFLVNQASTEDPALPSVSDLNHAIDHGNS